MSHTQNRAIYNSLSCKKTFEATFDGQHCQVVSDQKIMLKLEVESAQRTAIFKIRHCDEADSQSLALRIGIEHLLGHFSEIQKVTLESEARLRKGSILTHFEVEPGFYSLGRAEFFQMPGLWHGLGDFMPLSDGYTETAGRSHPVRPLAKPGYKYQRFIPQLGKTVSFRVIDPVSDLQIFYDWHHQLRVSEFWDLNKPLEELDQYLKKGLADSHQIPMIMEFDREPVGYFEFYWAPEDRLGAYYNYDAYDRGLHFLIGNEKFLGFNNTDVALKSACHFLFLDDPRTMRVMAEPRHDNKKVLKYVEAQGWNRIKEFDFPHKRAVLLENSRDVFFKRNV